jgi:hypothetical protein
MSADPMIAVSSANLGEPCQGCARYRFKKLRLTLDLDEHVRTPSLPPELVVVLADRQDAGSTGDPKIALLSQASNLREIERMGSGEWTILYSYEPGIGTTGVKCFYSALIPRTRVRKAMKNDSWEVMIGKGLPGFNAVRPLRLFAGRAVGVCA